MNQQTTNLSPDDVAKRLNVPKPVVRRMIAAGQLHCVKFNRKVWRVPLYSVEDFEAKERLFRIPTKSANPHNTA
jgi:excisionase family DNA binding protein